MGQPTIAINANFFDVRRQKGGSWRQTGCTSPLGAFVDNTHGQGRANQAVTGTVAYPGKQGLSGGGESWSCADDDDPAVGRRTVCGVAEGRRATTTSATPVIQDLLNKNAKFVAVSGIGLLAPGNTGQLHDGGPSAARTALAYSKQKDEMYIFEGGNYTPDNIQDLFRGLGSDTAVLLDGGGSSAIVLRRDTGGMWAGAGSPKGILRHPSGAVRLARAGAAQLAGLQLASGRSGFRGRRPESEDQQAGRDHRRANPEHRSDDEPRHGRTDKGAGAHRQDDAEAQPFAFASATGQPAVDAEADDRRRQHRGGEFLNAELAGTRVLQTEGDREAADQDQLGVVVIAQHSRAGQDRQRQQQHDFDRQHRGEPRPRPLTEVP